MKNRLPGWPTPWAEAPMLAVDLETTGVDPTTARTVTYAAVLVHPDGTVGSARIGSMNPGIPIPDGAAEVHGITTAEIQARHPDPVASQVAGYRDLMAAIIIATMQDIPLCLFNAAYDLTAIDHELRRLAAEGAWPDLADDRETLMRARVIDALVLDRRMDKWRKGSRRLADVAAAWNVEITDWHTADADAIAAARIAYAIAASRKPKDKDWLQRALNEQSAAETHDWQITAAAADAEGLRAYYERKGDTERAAGVNGEWPIRGISAELEATRRAQPGEEQTP